MADGWLRVLLIDDDEDDYILVRNMLSETLASRHHLDWVSTYDTGLEAMKRGQHDIYLLDYRLDIRNGLELLQEAVENGCRAPIIFLTGHGDYEIDIEAMKAGAADYLIKDQINPPLLERSIRYAIEQKRAEVVLRTSENRLRYLSSELLRAQEKERKRIAGELHDSIAASLSAMKFSVENTLQQVDERSPVHESLKTLVSQVQQTIEEARRIMADLRPSVLDDLGIVATTNWFCREFEKTYTCIRIQKRIDIDEKEVQGDLKTVIFRISQEAMHNIAKHSGATEVQFSLFKNGGAIELAIEDNGKGFDEKDVLHDRSSKGGLGLTSMRERAELSGGSFSIESTKGAGTMIKASWPLPQAGLGGLRD